jgi:hypothetical protein
MIDPKAIESAARAIVRRNCPSVTDGDVEEMSEGYVPDAQAALTAYHKHLAEAGLVIVPAEPTEAMVKAGVDLAFRIRLSPEYSWKDYMRDLHRAMIAAHEGN